MFEGPASPSALSSVAAILQALAWPAVAALFLITYRTRIKSLIDVLTKKLETATRVKAWQFEVETAEQEIKRVVDQTGVAANAEQLSAKVPESQVQAAREVNDTLRASPISDQAAIRAVGRQIRDLAVDYDQTRASMSSGPSRTRHMNEIAAKMRALSLAARPLLHTLMGGQTAGERLAAICILQVAPAGEYFAWLIERIMQEQQPFLLFQASLAVLELVRADQYENGDEVRKAIRNAIAHLQAYTGGKPDKNTIDVLNQALFLVR